MQRRSCRRTIYRQNRMEEYERREGQKEEEGEEKLNHLEKGQ